MLLPTRRLLLAAVANRSTLTHWRKGKNCGHADRLRRWVVPAAYARVVRSCSAAGLAHRNITGGEHARAHSLGPSPAAATLHRSLGGALGARDAAFCASRASRPRETADGFPPPLHRHAADGNYAILVTRGQGLRRPRGRIHRIAILTHTHCTYIIL